MASAAITAAAQEVDPEKLDKAGHRKRIAEWQDQVWVRYDAVPEVWFSTNYVANVLRRIRLFPAIQDDPTQPPVPLVLGADGTIAARAHAELNRLHDDSGTHGEVMHDLAMQLTLPGEAYMVLYYDEEAGRETCIITAIDEIKREDSNWVLVDGDGYSDEANKVLNDAVVYRIWRQHPHRRSQADSPMRPLLSVLDELADLDANAGGAAKSRIGTNGAWLVPDEINFKHDPRVNNGKGHGYSSDAFVDQFIAMGVTAMKNENSAARAIPGVLKVKGDKIAQFKYEAFGRSFTPEDAARYEVLLKRYAGGVDLPLEIVTGIQDLNHWNAWLIPEESFKAHLAPLVELICAGLTKAHMKPALADLNLDTPVIVWYDASAITSHPGRGSDADNAMRLGALSYEAYRRYRGYTESDAAGPDDIAMLKDLMVGKPGQPGQPGQPGPPPSAVTASAKVGRSDVGHALAMIDRNARVQLQVAVQGAMWRALDKAGMRVRQVIKGNPQLTSLVTNTEDRYVCAVLGEPAVRHFFATNDELLDDAAAPALQVYNSLVMSAQKRLRGIAASYGDYDVAACVARQDDSRDRGGRVLASAITSFIGSVMFAPDRPPPNGPTRGEYFTVFAPSKDAPRGGSTLDVPASLVRGPLAVAGGAFAPTIKNPATDQPEGGVTTGEDGHALLIEVGLSPVAWKWNYGDVGSRITPFNSHLELDGIEFYDWRDDQLTVQAGDEWLGTDYYFPGDHFWCQCDYEHVYD